MSQIQINVKNDRHIQTDIIWVSLSNLDSNGMATDNICIQLLPNSDAVFGKFILQTMSIVKKNITLNRLPSLYANK